MFGAPSWRRNLVYLRIGAIRRMAPGHGASAVLFLTELHMPGICRRWGLVAMVGLALIPALPLCAAENSPSGRYAELPGVKLWFTDTGGTGTPIVLLHAN